MTPEMGLGSVTASFTASLELSASAPSRKFTLKK